MIDEIEISKKVMRPPWLQKRLLKFDKPDVNLRAFFLIEQCLGSHATLSRIHPARELKILIASEPQRQSQLRGHV